MQSLLQVITRLKSEDACMEFLEKLRWPSGQPVSPFIKEEPVYRLKQKHQYKGSKSGKIFNVRYGTIFQHSRLPLVTWFTAISLLCSAKRGLSSYQLARHIHISQKSAYRMLMLIRKCLGPENEGSLKGIVEMDELYVGKHGNLKNQKAVKTPVFGMIDKRRVIMKCVKDVTKSTIFPLIGVYISKKAMLWTDEYVIYSGLKKAGYNHQICNHFRKVFVDKKTGATTNRIELAWRHLRGMLRNYNHVMAHNLQYYVDEFVFRYNNRKQKSSEIYMKALKLCAQ